MGSDTVPSKTPPLEAAVEEAAAPGPGVPEVLGEGHAVAADMWPVSPDA